MTQHSFDIIILIIQSVTSILTALIYSLAKNKKNEKDNETPKP